MVASPFAASTGEQLKASPQPRWTTSLTFRYALLFGLAMTEVMPLALLSSGMPAILRRNGASLEQLGILSLVMIPWAIKALWAPVVDKVGARSQLGRYRGWLLMSHSFLVAILILGSFIDIASLLLTNRAIGIPALFVLSIAAATADNASHGLAVNLLSAEERSLGNGIQTAGMMTGLLLGGGVMLILVDKLGWQLPLLIMAAAVFLSLLGVALYREPPVDPAQAITLRAALAFFRTPRIGRWLLILATVILLPALPSVPFQALFIDQGMSLSEIGFVQGILCSAAGIVGGAVSGILVKQLGRGRAFYVVNLLCVAFMASAFFIITRVAPGRTLLYLAASAMAFGSAVSTTTLRVLIMDRSRRHLASSDYSLQMSTASLFAFLGGGVGGVLAGRIGSGRLFVAAPVLLLAALLLFSRIFRGNDFSPAQTIGERAAPA